ncbi:MULTISPECIES: hypothetical protein [Roseateles]|uniref:Uncharacterized protein n=1 Tax=Roseateles albus TaxID=2987525 RepID=A0ABT5K944_9BURK|nr:MULTISPECIES: hypothetical protein [Roseateles]MCV2359968.1 hypothetical protein [Paucibacter sp. TC2R-5]MDC8770465.1 hypothetical protein [Roseateles albus]
MMTISVSTWWSLLCAVALFNIAAWMMSSLALHKRQALLPPKAYSMRRLQLLLSAGYVLGCAFRSALPVFDVPRLCLLDTWLSSVVVGRSVATIAELCFVAQWALLLHEVSSNAGSRTGKLAALAIVPMIAVAETFSWYSVLTTSNIGHVVEESLWGLSAALLVLSLTLIWPRLTTKQRPLLAAWCLIGVAYVVFMFMVDVPMYWSRWLADEASGRAYLSVTQGFADVAGRWTVSHRQQDWQSEMVWMTAYFSVAVWLSIALVHAPVVQPKAEQQA